MIGGGLLILSEVLEIAGGAFFNISYVVTISAFLVLAAGVWGLHAGQASSGGKLGLAGASVFTIGVLVNFAADLANPFATIEERTGLLAALGGSVLGVGAMLFGIAVLRAGVYPRWTGAATLAAYITPPLVLATGLPLVLTSLANMLFGSAMLVMGRQSRSEKTKG